MIEEKEESKAEEVLLDVEEKKEPTIVVAGLGELGTSVLRHICQRNRSNGYGYRVIGYDILLNIEFPTDFQDYYYEYSNDHEVFSLADIIVVCTPTWATIEGSGIDEKITVSVRTVLDTFVKVPTDSFKESPKLFVVESTLLPGTSEEIIDLMSKKGLVLGTDYYYGIVPSRFDNVKWPKPNDLDRIVGTFEDESLQEVKEFYGEFLGCKLWPTTPTTAELVKQYENFSRLASIEVVNAFSEVCVKHNVNPHVMLALASSKPNVPNVIPGFVGGNCLPDNSLMMLSICESPVFSMARYGKMRTDSLIETLISGGHKRVLVLGLAYKDGVTPKIKWPAGNSFVAALTRAASSPMYVRSYDFSHGLPFTIETEESEKEEKYDVVVVFRSAVQYINIIFEALKEGGMLYDFTGAYYTVSTSYKYIFVPMLTKPPEL